MKNGTLPNLNWAVFGHMYTFVHGCLLHRTPLSINRGVVKRSWQLAHQRWLAEVQPWKQPEERRILHRLFRRFHSLRTMRCWWTTWSLRQHCCGERILPTWFGFLRFASSRLSWFYSCSTHPLTWWGKIEIFLNLYESIGFKVVNIVNRVGGSTHNIVQLNGM